MDAFADLAQRVRTHICYSHIFGDALTEEQLVARCAPDAPRAVGMEIARLEAEGHIERVGEHWFLRGEGVEGLSKLERAGEAAADEILQEHATLLGLLQRLPIVRLLAISGSVAWGNHGRRNGKELDLDLFVITAPGGVHVVRLLLRAWGLAERSLARLGLRRSRVPICPNYMTDGAFLEVANKSFYTASDALNVRVLKGDEEYRRFVAANAWMGRYYPIGVPGLGPTADPPRNPALVALNLTCFVALAACSWLKLKLTNWRRSGDRPLEFVYSFRFEHGTHVCLLRSAPAGGGRQPQVARRFGAVYTRHFGPDESLQAFLFPGTTEGGVHTTEGYVRSTIVTRLGYHE